MLSRKHKRILEDNKTAVTVAGVIVFVIVVLLVGGKLFSKDNNKNINSTDTTVINNTLQRPVPKILPEKITLSEGNAKTETWSFDFPKTWNAKITANDKEYSNILLTPDDENMAPVLFSRQRQKFLDLQGMLDGYLGGLDNYRTYYSSVKKQKVSMDGAKGYKLVTIQKETKDLSVAFFSWENYISFSFTSGSGTSTVSGASSKSTKKQVTNVTPEMETMAASFKFLKEVK